MRSSRRASPQNTKKTGAVPIQGIAGISAASAARFSESTTRMIETCWKSDFDEADSAAAVNSEISPSGTGRGA